MPTSNEWELIEHRCGPTVSWKTHEDELGDMKIYRINRGSEYPHRWDVRFMINDNIIHQFYNIEWDTIQCLALMFNAGYRIGKHDPGYLDRKIEKRETAKGGFYTGDEYNE